MAAEGWLVVDKPEGWTSHDVVARVRRALQEKRIGHTGTLDPLASGVLVLLCGRWTRLSRYVTDLEKTYEGVLRLGKATDSGDREGAVTAEGPVPDVDGTALERLAAAALGAHLLAPPAKSAKKVQGVPAYVRARRDEDVQLEPVPMTVREARFTRIPGAPADLGFTITCSKGTYVRSLAVQWAQMLGTVGHVAALRRTRVDRIGLLGAGPPDAPPVPSLDPALLLPFPLVRLSGEEARQFLAGSLCPRAAAGAQGDLAFAVRELDGEPLGVGAWEMRGLQPRTVIAGVLPAA